MKGSNGWFLPSFLLCVIICAPSCRDHVENPLDAGGDGTDSATDGDADSSPFTGDADELVEPDGLPSRALTGVQPNHGSFTGGAEVLLRGRGFVEGLTVLFGGRQVELADMTLADENRLTVMTPAGEPGTVDVTVTFPDGEAMTLEQGYTYDSWYLDPQTGSVAGGTLVRLLGIQAEFDPESIITFDGAEATDVVWVSPDEMSCRSPSGTVGPADVTVEGATRSSILHDVFTYYDSSDPRNGGLGGGPIDGTLDVTVLDALTGSPLPDSFVILGTDGETSFQGRTNMDGRITFSDSSLGGRQSITVAHAPVDVYDAEGEYIGQTLFESATIVEFDARSVTILLEPIPPPQAGPPPPGRRGGYIEGELLFEHQGEFGPYEWSIVPEPAEDEVKIAYVYTTHSSIQTTRIEPGVEGVVYNSAEFVGDNGYRFRIYSVPGTVAVYSFAGLGTLARPGDTSSEIIDFVPYVMGVARGVVVGPDETVTGIQVLMTRQMSQNITIDLENAPLADESGTPNLYIMDVYLDLGAEGVISRPETQLREISPFGSFNFPGWVEISGNISSASYTVVAGAWTLWDGYDEEQNPWSVVYRTGITDIESTIVIDEFLAIPRALNPEQGAVVENNHMEWEAIGGTTPDFSVATLSIPSGIMTIPYWMIVLRGGETSYDLPDLAALADMPEHPLSDVTWSVWSFSVEEGFEFDTWSYRYLYSRYWSAYAVDTWYVRLSDD